jgi:hypothetical protein
MESAFAGASTAYVLGTLLAPTGLLASPSSFTFLPPIPFSLTNSAPRARESLDDEDRATAPPAFHTVFALKSEPQTSRGNGFSEIRVGGFGTDQH